MLLKRKIPRILLILFFILITTVPNIWAEEIPEKTVITSVFWYPYTDALAVETGNPKIINDYPYEDRTDYCDSEGKENVINIEWDLSNIDPDTPGLYFAVGTFILPENTVYSPDITLPIPTIPVSVQAPGNPRIDCFYMGRGEIRFPWVGFSCPLEEVSVWLSKNNGEWSPLSENQIQYIDNFELALSAKLFEDGASYALQVRYTGGQTGILNFIYKDGDMVYNYNEGNRDGDDAVDDDIPRLPHPPQDSIIEKEDSPIPEQPQNSPNNEPETSPILSTNSDLWKFSEKENTQSNNNNKTSSGTPSENTLILSGLELQQMAANYEDMVPFAFNDLLLLLPVSFINGLNLPEDGLFTLTMNLTEDHTFTLFIKSGDQVITDLPGVKMKIPLKDALKIDKIHLSGDQTPLDYSIENNIVTLSLNQTGTYKVLYMTDHAVTPIDETKIKFSRFSVVSFIILLLIIIYFYFRKKRRHENMA